MDKETIDSAGLSLSRARRFSDRGANQKDTGQFDIEEEVFGICAAAACYRASMFDEIKKITVDEIFDNDFFLLVEDVDLAWRARHAGYKALYLPDAVCYHIRGGAGWRSKNKQYLSFRNRYYLIIKNDYLSNILLHLPVFLIYDISRFFYMAFTNRLLWKALKEITQNLSAMKRKRKSILSKSKIKPKDIRKWL